VRTEAPRVAITTDWLTSFGGGERVVEQLVGLYPSAPVYTSVFDPARVPERLRSWDVRPSALQRLPGVRRYSRALLPLMPWAFRQFDFSRYDVVITASSAFSKSIETRGATKNICYCHTPPRYIWDLTHEYTDRVPLSSATRPMISWLRQRDQEAARQVHRFVANSAYVADRIERAYGRTATVVHPPVDTDRIRPSGLPPEDFYLVVSRLVPYKRIDLAVRACSMLNRRLLVVGTGPEERRLRSIAGPAVQFCGGLPDSAVGPLYARCKAFLFPGCEDFGISAVEAQAAGRPVVAFGRGGATETVIDGSTGVLFDEQSVNELAGAIERLDHVEIDPAACRQNAIRFDASIFQTGMRAVIDAVLAGGVDH
jgi:glycosyltransferase involved in cell wall biosynthesis